MSYLDLLYIVRELFVCFDKELNVVNLHVLILIEPNFSMATLLAVPSSTPEQREVQRQSMWQAQMFQLLLRSLNIETEKSPNLFHSIYVIPASLWVLTTYGKLSEQKIMSPVKYLVSQLPNSTDILNHKNFGTLFLVFWCTISFMIFFGAA